MKEAIEKRSIESFFALLINFLEQAERADSNGKLLETVKNYFYKCKKTYMLEVNQLKYKDEGKKTA